MSVARAEATPFPEDESNAEDFALAVGASGAELPADEEAVQTMDELIADIIGNNAGQAFSYIDLGHRIFPEDKSGNLYSRSCNAMRYYRPLVDKRLLGRGLILNETKVIRAHNGRARTVLAFVGEPPPEGADRQNSIEQPQEIHPDNAKEVIDTQRVEVPEPNPNEIDWQDNERVSIREPAAENSRSIRLRQQIDPESGLPPGFIERIEELEERLKNRPSREELREMQLRGELFMPPRKPED